MLCVCVCVLCSAIVPLPSVPLPLRYSHPKMSPFHLLPTSQTHPSHSISLSDAAMTKETQNKTQSRSGSLALASFHGLNLTREYGVVRRPGQHRSIVLSSSFRPDIPFHPFSSPDILLLPFPCDGYPGCSGPSSWVSFPPTSSPPLTFLAAPCKGPILLPLAAATPCMQSHA